MLPKEGERNNSKTNACTLEMISTAELYRTRIVYKRNKGRNKNMNILFVVNKCNIFKINSGGALRNNLFVRALSEIGNVDIIAFDSENEISNIQNCNVIFSKIMKDTFSRFGGIRSIVQVTFWPKNPNSYYQVIKEKETIIDSFVKKRTYDIIVCRYVDSTIRCGLLKYKNKLIIDADDNIESILKKQAAQSPFILGKWKYLYKAKRIREMLPKLFDEILCSYCPNKKEFPSNKTIFLHNTSVLCNQNDRSSIPNQILFVGLLNFLPCRDGITHFVDLIFPKIKNVNPLAKLRVIGEGEQVFLDYLNSIEGVEAVGRVDDLAFEYQKAAIVVIPIYYGYGTSIKFVEAMLMNRPVVSSPVGARGFSERCQDGVHYMLANNDEEFASKTLELLSSASKSKEIADNGYHIANQYFSQERFMEIIKDSILKRLGSIN